MGHAHSAVGKHLDLQLMVGAATNLGHLLEAQFTSQYYPLCPQVEPALGRGVVGDGLLGADVALTVRGILPRHGECAQIGDNEGIHTRRVQPLQMGGQGVHFPTTGHGVDGHMGLDPVVMGVAHGGRQFIIGKVAREGAHTEGCARQIDGICAVGHRHFQFFHVPCRGQQFRLFPVH